VRAPRIIGILGGMGPQATILLQQKVLKAVEAVDDCDHIPLIVDMNPQVPSRIEHLIHQRGDDPAPVLANMARRLETAGAQALAMPCNTAHHYGDAIRGAVSLPFLDMVELSADHALDEIGKGGCIGILASPAVRMTGLFDGALAARGLTSLWPKDDAKMLRAIQAVKADGPCPEAREIIATAAGELAARGADLLLVACSEFSMLVDSIATDLQVVDTLDVLVQAIREFSIEAAELPESVT
jgi:aspartate racemase